MMYQIICKPKCGCAQFVPENILQDGTCCKCGKHIEFTTEENPKQIISHNSWKMNILTDRMNDIAEAIREYSNACMVYPKEWIDEWNELLKEQQALKNEMAEIKNGEDRN